MTRRAWCPVGWVLITLLLLSLGPAGTAASSDPASSLSVALDVATGGCESASHEEEILAFRDRLATAPTPEAARALALSQTRLAHQALARARWILPFSATVREAGSNLDAYEARLRQARTQEAVAAEFGGPVRVASGGDSRNDGAHARVNCDYTTTEIVIIVIGFILGIIPGIIFLFLFC